MAVDFAAHFATAFFAAAYFALTAAQFAAAQPYSNFAAEREIKTHQRLAVVITLNASAHKCQ